MRSVPVKELTPEAFRPYGTYANSVPIKELTPEAFRPYGTYANFINPNALKIGEEPVEFYRDMIQLDLGGKSVASFSICRVGKRPPVVDVTEYHSACGELNLPLDADIAIHVAPATPNGEVPVDRIEVFRVPKGTVVSMRPGVWHHAPFALDSACANVLVVLPERTYANDCTVYDIPEADRVDIKDL